MHRGYIKLWRRFVEWDWYSDQHTKCLFLHLLLTANYKTTRYRGVDVERGQCIIGRKTLAKTLGMSEQNVRTALTHLKSTNEVTSKSYSKFSIATIINYDLYQQNDHVVNQQVTSNQPASNQQVTTSKECKNVKNDKNKNIDTYVDQREKEPDRPPDEAYEAFETRLEDNWHKLCEKNPKITDIRRIGVRKDKIKARWKEKDFREFLPEIFSKIDKSDWLTGKKSSWVITFDWLINNNKNYIKILEGQYENK